MANLYFIKMFLKKKNISLVSQIGLSKNNLDSLDAVRQETNIGCNFLEWSGLRSAIPFHEEGWWCQYGNLVMMLPMTSVWLQENSIIIC